MSLFMGELRLKFGFVCKGCTEKNCLPLIFHYLISEKILNILKYNLNINQGNNSCLT